MSDEIFDPEIHAADKDGNPTLNKDGSFRKKRKDAGTRPAKPTSAKGTAADPRARYVKSVSDVLVIPAGLLSLVDPVDGYCATELVPLWADALADVAVEQPQLAAVLDKLSGVGAVGGLAAVALLSVFQFGSNHGKIPPSIAGAFGAKPREEIEAILTQRGQRLATRKVKEAAQDAEDMAMGQAYADDPYADHAPVMSETPYADAAA